MIHLKHLSLALAVFALASTSALAEWYRAAEIATTGGAKEIAANFQNVQAVQVQWVDGDVDLLSITVRSVGQKQEFPIGRKLDHGETIDFTLDGRDITGFRVIDRGNGHYRVNVQTDDTQYVTEHHHHHHPPRHLPPDGIHDADYHDFRQPPATEKPGRPNKPGEVNPPATGKPGALKQPGEVTSPAKKDSPKPPKKTPSKSAPKAPPRSAPPKGR